MKNIFVTIGEPYSEKKDLLLKLPMPLESLNKKIDDYFHGKDFLITDLQGMDGYIWNEFDSIFLLNDFANFIEENEIDETIPEKIFQIEQDLKTVMRILENESYAILEVGDSTAITEEEILGELLFKENLLEEDIPQDLVDKGYIDFASIGRDYGISQGWMYCKDYFITIRQ